jgi:hypothetical protein
MARWREAPAVIVQGQVRSGPIVVIGVSAKQMPKMPLAKYQDMVKALASDRPNQPLTMAILPWRPRRDRPIPNTHCSKAPDEDLAINAVPIADEIAWPLFPAISLHQLATYPFRAGMRGRCKTQDFAASMLQNQQPIQELKRDCWDHKQVQRGNPVGV